MVRVRSAAACPGSHLKVLNVTPDAPLERYQGSQAAMLAMLILVANGLVPEMPDTSVPIGHRKDGTPIYPIAGGDDQALATRIQELTAAILATQAADAGNKASDAGASGAAQDAIVQSILSRLTQAGRSKAASIGDGSGVDAPVMFGGGTHPMLKAALGEKYVPGALVTALANARSTDITEQMAGKAMLDTMGLRYQEAPEVAGKATLGTTGATGGYVLPNNLVDEVAKPNVGFIDWPTILTTRDNVAVRGVDAPYRLGPPTRMTAQDWGQTKENVDETYGSYSSTLVTFARIYDVAKQYLRISAGAAEQDVMDELAKAAHLTVEYSVLAGPGTGTVGSGDATLGIVTSILATPTWLGYRSAKTGAASNSTVAGSFASALAEMGKLMSARGRFPSVVAVDSATYWTLLAQGSDTAGFWLDPKASGGFTIDASGGLSYWGVPIRHSPNFDAYVVAAGGASKCALAIEGKAFKLYRGSEFRIDSSDVAGTRWDKNLVGFRGEMELGFNAETGVHTGAAQLLTAVIP